MTAQEFIQENYPRMKKRWNEDNVDDNWAEMMEAYHDYKLIRQYPVTNQAYPLDKIK